MGLFLNHTSKKSPVSTTLHLDLLLCQHWWHLPQPGCMTACLQTLPEPQIYIINAVNPDLGKKKKREVRPEGTGVPTSMLFLPGMQKRTQACHALNESVIAQFSCCWWCSSSYNTQYYLMRWRLVSCFSQFLQYPMRPKKGNSLFSPSSFVYLQSQALGEQPTRSEPYICYRISF